MLNSPIPDLRVHSISIGPQGHGYDLKRLLYRGAARAQIQYVERRIARGDFGPLLNQRISLLKSIHEVIEDAPISRSGKIVMCSCISSFIKWVDTQRDSTNLSQSTVKDFLLDYAVHLQRRVRITKDLKQNSANIYLNTLTFILGPTIDPDTPDAHILLREQMNIPKTKSSKRSLGINSDKQRLDDTFKFGSFLKDLCTGLTKDVLRGPLPIDVNLANGEQVVRLSPSGFKYDLDIDLIPWKHSRERALRLRTASLSNIEIIKQRYTLINMRIYAEMLIFVAQTGMNLTQVKGLPRATYRWQTSDENYIVKAVYKARRQGVARFVIFRAYREHFTNYIKWLDSLDLNEEDDRLFPIIYHTQIPSEHKLPTFDSLKHHCKKLGINFVGPRKLRKTRINWLLRRSRDPDLTAEMSAHSKEVLLRVYEEGDLQSASQEIGRYYSKTDPALIQNSNNPICLGSNSIPTPINEIPKEAPKPDCVTPEGCLWCEHFRDVLAPDYCWRLVSHRHLKSLEVGLFQPSTSQPIHPGYLVIDRLNMKLKAISEYSTECSSWVKEAEDLIREGDYHPSWTSLINILEELV